MLTDAFARPAVHVEGDGFLDLVRGEAPGTAEAGILHKPGDCEAVHPVGLGELVGLLPCLVAGDQLGLLV